MPELNEDVLYKNYLFHPIWKNRKSMTDIFALKGYELVILEGYNRESILNTLREKMFSTNAVVMVECAELANYRLQATRERTIAGAIRKHFGYDTVRTMQLMYEVGSIRKENPVIKIQTKHHTAFFVMSKDTDILKFIYSVIPEPKAISPHKIIEAIRSQGEFQDMTEEVIKGRVGIASSNIVTLAIDAVDKVLEESKMSYSRLNEFLTKYELDEDNRDVMPLSAVAYFSLKDKLPLGWQMALDLKQLTLHFRFNEPVIVNNAYVQDKVTALKVPMWLERIYLNFAPDLKMLTNPMGYGFHNDMGNPATPNGLKNLCTGELKISRIKQFINDKEYDKAIELFRQIPRSMSVTNLDHPHWQFSSIDILNAIQVIGYDPNEVDDMVITDASIAVATPETIDDPAGVIPRNRDEVERANEILGVDVGREEQPEETLADVFDDGTIPPMSAEEIGRAND